MVDLEGDATSRWRGLFGVGLAVSAAVAGLVFSLFIHSDGPMPPEVDGFLWPNPKRITPFFLSDHHGKAFDEQRLNDHWSLMFFGYTHCPDVCPLTLTTLQAVQTSLARAEVDTQNLQIVFVSVDPERDTLEHLNSYVSFFGNSVLGVTGPIDALEGLTRQLGILHVTKPADDAGNYMVDHSAAVLLIDPQSRLVGVFQSPHSVDNLAQSFREIQAFVLATTI